MRIRDRLTISFSTVAALIFLIFGLAVYFFSSQYRKNEFYNRLRQRVNITEKVFLEKENFSMEDYERIREQFLNTLPEETEEIVRFRPGFEKTLDHEYPGQFLEGLAEFEESYFDENDRQGAGKVFHLQDGDYLVVITAVDQFGIKKMSYLLTIIVLGVVCCILVIVMISYYLSFWLLRPISEKIRKANTISITNLHERLTVRDPENEMGELAVAFNHLLDRLERAFDTQKSFIANASHEMRNPLTAILGETELALNKQRATDEYVRSLEAISYEADRLNALVNNLLKLSSIGSIEKSIKREKVSVRMLVTEAIDQFSFIHPDHQLCLSAQPDLDEMQFCVLANRSLLHTALINILDNACKFSANEEVKISVYELPSSQVAIEVMDKGIGIPKEDIPKVVLPFHRAENVRHIKGSGIGIPLTLRIIELHGGTLHIDSILGRGTTVRIVLPVVTEKVSPEKSWISLN